MYEKYEQRKATKHKPHPKAALGLHKVQHQNPKYTGDQGRSWGKPRVGGGQDGTGFTETLSQFLTSHSVLTLSVEASP